MCKLYLSHISQYINELNCRYGGLPNLHVVNFHQLFFNVINAVLNAIPTLLDILVFSSFFIYICCVLKGKTYVIIMILATFTIMLSSVEHRWFSAASKELRRRVSYKITNYERRTIMCVCFFFIYLIAIGLV